MVPRAGALLMVVVVVGSQLTPPPRPPPRPTPLHLNEVGVLPGLYPQRNETTIILMGLPKTGTTAAAQALVSLGFRVAHNQGDVLGPTCDAIGNTLEDKYVALDGQHPRAAWILTVSANTTAWLDSVRSHVQRVANTRESHGAQHRRPPKRDGYLDCRFFGCALGLPRRGPRAMGGDGRAMDHIRIDQATRTVDSRDIEKLRAAMVRYQTGLLAYFRAREDTAIVDVRAGTYVGLDRVLSGRLVPLAPFVAFNTRASPGPFPKCDLSTNAGTNVGPAAYRAPIS